MKQKINLIQNQSSYPRAFEEYMSREPVDFQARCKDPVVKEGIYRVWNRGVRDDLSGLFRREYLHADLNRRVAVLNRAYRGLFLPRFTGSETRRAADLLNVTLYDIDEFKELNDTLGHLEGDKAIRSTGRILTSNYRDTDTLSRMGGDEFVVISDGPLEMAITRATEVVDIMTSFNLSDGTPYPLSLSYGIAAWGPGMTPEELLANADRAMYNQKNIRKGSPPI